MSFDQSVCVVVTVVLVFELCWRYAAEVVEEAAVVEPVNPFDGRKPEVIEASSGAFVSDRFGLVEPEDRFGHRVVIGIVA